MRKLIVALVLALPLTALADIAPPDTCAKPGDACTTAPPDYKSAGVCVKRKCTRATPRGTVEYDCNRCEAKPAPSKK